MKDKNYKAFQKILDVALKVKTEDSICIVYDESFRDHYFADLVRIILRKKLAASFVFIPTAYQEVLCKYFVRNDDEIDLPASINRAIGNANIILSFLSNHYSLSKVRGAIVHSRTLINSKLLHCPGISDDVLSLILKSPYPKVIDDTELLAWSIGAARVAKIITNHKGREYELKIQLDGWKTEPIISSGVIDEGSWGNITPGETFCCPSNNVEGNIYIDGSIPGVPFKKGEGVLLSFKRGN